MVKLVTLEWCQKVKYPKILITKSISKIFIPNFVWVFTNKIYNTYLTEFSFWYLGMPEGLDLGVLGAQNLSVGIFDGVTSTARSSIVFVVLVA